MIRFFLFLPVALLAMLIPYNQYDVGLGISGLDCDSPLVVLLFAIPGFIIYGTLSCLYLKSLINNRHIKDGILATCSIGLILLMIPNTYGAIAAIRLCETVYSENSAPLTAQD